MSISTGNDGRAAAATAVKTPIEAPSAPRNAVSPAYMSPLALAYVGDAVYELFVRERLARAQAGSVNALHVAATRFSRCSSQAAVIKRMHGELDDSEKDIVRRARNAKPGYVPKNASVVDYHNATGFEALVGFLYLNGDSDRLTKILETAAKCVDGDDARSLPTPK